MRIVKAKIKMRDGSLSNDKYFIETEDKYYPLDIVLTQPSVPKEQVIELINIFKIGGVTSC